VKYLSIEQASNYVSIYYQIIDFEETIVDQSEVKKWLEEYTLCPWRHSHISSIVERTSGTFQMLHCFKIEFWDKNIGLLFRMAWI
jgi:hypothetical protein